MFVMIGAPLATFTETKREI